MGSAGRKNGAIKRLRPTALRMRLRPGSLAAWRTHLQDALHRILDPIERAFGFVGPLLGVSGTLLRGLEVRGQGVDALLVVLVDLIQPAFELLHLAFGDAPSRLRRLE